MKNIKIISNTKNTSAYTLIELLVGITIISIVFTIGYTGFREFSRRQALSGVIKSIKADLRLVQQLASTGQKPDPSVGACTQLNSYTFIIATPSRYRIGAICKEGTRIIKIVNLDTDIVISPDPSNVRFKVLGQGTNLGADYVITLTHTSGTTGTIVVGIGGEIN